LLIFAASPSAGVGKSVTGCNVAYRSALAGSDVCYLDFDFGTPTAGAIFQIAGATRGVRRGGLHSYLLDADSADQPGRIDVWTRSTRAGLRQRPPRSGELTLFPGDQDAGEFGPDKQALSRCVRLLEALDEEFDLCLVDLGPGRSYATRLVLEATAGPALRDVTTRWLVFHRWTRQHIPAASGLVHGVNGILDVGVSAGHDRERLGAAIRFVRTAVIDPDSIELSSLRPAQVAWLRDCDEDLRRLAAEHRVGRSAALASIPLDPVLQWREQLISDDDVAARDIANGSTVAAFEELSHRLTDDEWSSA
jgi:hypothetical protein